MAEITESIDEASVDQVPTLARQVMGRLRRDILEGALPPGSRLRIEGLRERYGVGASPLREALSQLAAEELVLRVDQRGFRVASAEPETLRDLIETRCLVETAALRAAIARGDAAWEERVLVAHHRLARTSRSAKPERFVPHPEWEAHHRAFHWRCWRAAGRRRCSPSAPSCTTAPCASVTFPTRSPGPYATWRPNTGPSASHHRPACRRCRGHAGGALQADGGVPGAGHGGHAARPIAVSIETLILSRPARWVDATITPQRASSTTPRGLVEDGYGRRRRPTLGQAQAPRGGPAPWPRTSRLPANAAPSRIQGTSSEGTAATDDDLLAGDGARLRAEQEGRQGRDLAGVDEGPSGVVAAAGRCAPGRAASACR